MADKNLPPGWLAFESDDGEWYYYNEKTQETTWDKPKPEPKLPPKPVSRPPPVKAAPAPATTTPKPAGGPGGRPNPFGGGGGGRSDLLAGIQGGTKLKKVKPKPAKEPEKAAPAGMGGMMGMGGGGSSGGGGFKEIMRKNKEAAAKKAAAGGGGGGSTAPRPSTKPSGVGGFKPNPGALKSTGQSKKWGTPGVSTSQPKPAASAASSSISSSGGGGGSVEDRLASIEDKLDKIMKHLKIS